ncbi:MAG: N-formylglutamate amidohydrolase [Rhodobiaceae bacterium]|nr:N-formylglutamate amidohydrolase [Rhodobiaceae bacterium]MCC0040936.1 N-formylglutamate amidohydrolase [Rhodobiaceae bacterium]
MTSPHHNLDPGYSLVLPPAGLQVPFVFNSPHSGTHYPAAFVASSRLDLNRLRRSEDTFVEELFAMAPAHGAALMHARFPRAYVDLNREPYELDPQMFDGPLPRHANTRSMRVAGGLGTIARVVADAEPIYAGRIPVAEALARIETHYKPYHARLDAILADARARFGVSVLIDCHSMPSARVGGDEHTKPDFVLGDRYGTSCAAALADLAHETLSGLGYTVARNKPYAGGFITERYGVPGAASHALQIEINRGLYMNEARYTRARGFSWLRTDLVRLVERLVSIDLSHLRSPQIAAE